MLHYIALSHESTSIAGAHSESALPRVLDRIPATWQLALRAERLSIYWHPEVDCTDAAMTTYVLPDGGGVVFGCLYRTSSPERPVEASELDSNRIIDSLGRDLLENYWGSYVAILRSRQDDRVLVIRDCTGRIPCYYVKTGGHHAFFSDMRDVQCLGLRVTINRRYLASYILHNPLHIRDTGLNEVTEMLAGDGVLLSAKAATHVSLWRPWSIAATAIGDDYAQAQSALVATTEHVAGMWAARYRRILLNLSGGIDSSVVLGCLEHIGATDRVVCVHRYLSDTDDDERIYARAAAREAGVRLIECQRTCDSRTFLKNLRSSPVAPKPDYTIAHRMICLDELRQIAQRLHCDSVWTGQGGDHVFLQARDPWPATDYLLTHWLPYRFHRIIYESSVLSRRSIWSILSQTLQYLFRLNTVPPDPFGVVGSEFLTRVAIRDLAYANTAGPWHAAAPQLPPGKQAQIAYLAELLNRHEQLPALGWPYECHPLISQPLLELSLRIPTYLLLRGGRQRAMARKAFSDRVPACILAREDKGSIRAQTRILLRGAADFVREELLQGALVSMEIVDQASLERIFVAGETYKPAQVSALLACLAAEIWARQWA